MKGVQMCQLWLFMKLISIYLIIDKFPRHHPNHLQLIWLQVNQSRSMCRLEPKKMFFKLVLIGALECVSTCKCKRSPFCCNHQRHHHYQHPSVIGSRCHLQQPAFYSIVWRSRQWTNFSKKGLFRWSNGKTGQLAASSCAVGRGEKSCKRHPIIAMCVCVALWSNH